jgi:hypothetical protein
MVKDAVMAARLSLSLARPGVKTPDGGPTIPPNEDHLRGAVVSAATNAKRTGPMKIAFSKHVLMTAGAALALAVPALTLAQSQDNASQPGSTTSGSTMSGQASPGQTPDDQTNPSQPSNGQGSTMGTPMPGASATDSQITSGQGSAADSAAAPAPGSQITSGQGSVSDMATDASGMKTYPPCSATVTDSCMQHGGSGKAHRSKRRHHG